MTRKQITEMLGIHFQQREIALRNLRGILETSEARGQEVRWSRLLIIHTAMIEWLEGLKPDDE